uniref:uncharacterized protein LOC122597137 n=1 Tax=Erigeron canadensis TaxID=72917 RepID=UPI001CB9AC99|nr:uncharacterized protein LOC122597137 [Erigeron canadensis]
MHDPTLHWKLIHPFKGERFESIEQFKDSIIKYALANGYPLYYEDSKSTHVLVKCGVRNAKEKGIVVENPCPFRLWASWIQDESTFEIKSLRTKHTCSKKQHLSGIVTAWWIARQFGDKIRMSKKITLSKLRHMVMRLYNVRVTLSQCSKARAKAIYDMTTILNNHYARIWDYAEAINKTNLGSTVEVNVQSNPDGTTTIQRFICVSKLARKGTAQGELLSAVGRDANNQVFPIAWALVDVETKENWLWFCRLIQNDLGLGNGDGIAIISYQHKGLIEAVAQVLPNCEHRQCARHVYANFSKKWAGVYFKNYFWQAAKAFYEPGLDCDSVENGICECWNSMIKDFRKMPIIHMFEEIRRKVMTRLNDQRLNGQSWTDDICPNSAYNSFLGIGSCRAWQLSGILCLHAVKAIYAQYKEPEPFVSDSLRKDKFLATYMYDIRTVGGEYLWPKTNRIPPLAPPLRRMPGRPTVKRKRESNEDGPIMSTKSKKCSNCCQYGHNARSCSKVPLPRQPKIPKKRGRPKIDGRNSGPNQAGGRGDGPSQGAGGRGDGGRSGGGRGGGGRGGGAKAGGLSGEGQSQPMPQSAPVQVGVEDQNIEENVTNLHEDEPIQQSALVGTSQRRMKMIPTRKPFVPLRKKSERIINRKLTFKVVTKDGVGSSSDKPLTVE